MAISRALMLPCRSRVAGRLLIGTLLLMSHLHGHHAACLRRAGLLAAGSGARSAYGSTTCVTAFLDEAGMGKLVYLARQTQPGWNPPSKMRGLTVANVPPVPVAPEVVPSPDIKDANLAAVMEALRLGDPELHDAFALDEMARRPVLRRHITRYGTCPAIEPRHITDIDVSALQERLQLAGMKKVGREVVHAAIDHRAAECAFHPVREWLRGLAWDGVHRLDTWLSCYLGAEASPYPLRTSRRYFAACTGCQTMTDDTLNPGLPEWRRAMERARADAKWSVGLMGEVAAFLDYLAETERKARVIAMIAEARGRHDTARWARDIATALRAMPVALPPEIPALPLPSLPLPIPAVLPP